MSDFILITGGARSGKSTFAEQLAAHPGRPVIYIATAQVLDDEMALRVEKHKRQRPSHWQLIEEPFDIPTVLEEIRNEDAVVLLDCITIWLSNLMLKNFGSTQESACSDTLTPEAEKEILFQVQRAATLAQEISPQVIMVTNEVGQGIVPDNPMARSYRDLAGRSNQLLAHKADNVFCVVAGYPMEIKHSGQNLLNSLKPRQEH